MWYAALVKFLRRRLVLGVIFTLSLTYCVISFLGKTEFLENDDLVPARRTQPFIWRTLQQHQGGGGGGGAAGGGGAVRECRNSVQGKALIVDDRGYVCPRRDVLPSGCCNERLPTAAQYSCETCRPTDCCAVYEHCVGCCLHPDKRALLEGVLGRAQAQHSVLFASVADHFELCLAKCRTSSQSVRHENSYRDPAARHCFGEAAPGD